MEYFLSSKFRRDVKRLYTVGFRKKGLGFVVVMNPRGGGVWKVVWCLEAQVLVESV